MKKTTSVVSNVWIKQIEFEKKGDIMEGHRHIFDHQHLLTSGKVRVTVGDTFREYEAPKILFIPRDTLHSIEAISDTAVGYCIHPIRDGYRVEDIVDPDSVPKIGGDLILDTLIDETEKFIDTEAKPWGSK
jgi:hypothetical protein